MAFVKVLQKKMCLLFNGGFVIWILITGLTNFPATVFGKQFQDKDQYIISNEAKLEIVVHIWGEVNNPGKYKVRDDTNVLELISTAGGPTEYSNLRNVQLTRGEIGSVEMNTENTATGNALTKPTPKNKLVNAPSRRVIKIDLKKYLEHPESVQIPVLRPGDVVRVNRNKWYTIQTVIRVISQVAIIAQAWYYYSQSDK